MFPSFLRFFQCLSLVMLLVSGAPSVAGPLSPGDRASLQAGMQQHIDRNLVDGAYLHLDLDSGEVASLHPAAAHPMILRMGPYFVLCTDFRDARGNPVNVDFYMARRGRSFSVFHASVAERGRLEALMKAGKVHKAD